MSALTWNTDKPTEPGWYWWRLYSESAAIIVGIRRSAYGKLLAIINNEIPRNPNVMRVQWAGPIPEPEEGR